MDNPHELQAPNEPFEQTIALAKDLAYGVKVGLWPPQLKVGPLNVGRGLLSWFKYDENTDVAEIWYNYLEKKWSQKEDMVRPPLDISYLQIYGFVEQHGEKLYLLTPRAMSLLETPIKPPKVFIAYGRQQSSAFALLIEAKLQERGVSVFIDKILEGGEEWQQRIESVIRNQIDYFICLIAPDTLRSPNVRNEIYWALETERVFTIPIWHGNFRTNLSEIAETEDYIQEFIDKKTAIRVVEESAEQYQAALDKLLNQLQFASADERLFT